MRFRTKLTIAMILLTSVIYGVGGAALISLSFRGSLRLEQSQAMRSYRSMQSTLILVNSVSEQNSEQDVADILKQMDEQGSDWDMLGLSDEKGYLYRSGDVKTDPELKQNCSETQCAFRVFENSGGHFLQITGCFNAGESLLYLDAVRDISNLYTLRNTQSRIYRIFFIIVTALSAVISFVTAHFLTMPLRHLSRVSKKIGEGDLTLRSDVHSGDEMEQLSDTFNVMAENLVQKIQALEDAMEQQERFMGSFAHELKTPMTSMIGYADLMRSCDLPSSERRECAEYIFREGRRLERLSLKLLDLLVLKKQDFELTEASPAKLLDDAARSVDAKLRQNNVILTIQSQEGVCLLETDLIKSLLINLIDNSIKSMEHGGSIRIRQIMLSGGGCRIVILDNGRGIPRDELEKITEAFYRVDKSRSRKQGGAGLGLALCAEIVKLHNGKLDFFSEVGKGTLINVELRGKKE